MFGNIIRNLQNYSNDVRALSRYIEFSEKNYKVYSLEIASLILMSCTEIDSLLHSMCGGREDKLYLSDYIKYITNNYPRFHENKYELYYNNLQFTPWSNIGLAKPKAPDWWNGYNDIKHYRYEFLEKANLEHLLECSAALYSVVSLKYYNDNHKMLNISTDDISPIFFHVSENADDLSPCGMFYEYNLII